MVSNLTGQAQTFTDKKIFIRGTAMEKIIHLCGFCVFSEAGGKFNKGLI